MDSTAAFYQDLSNIRELFHKYGSFDDSNAKLDEIAKYISMYVVELDKIDDGITIKQLLSDYENNKEFSLVKEIKNRFDKVAKSSSFLLKNGRSVFGDVPVLNISDDDNEFAWHLLSLVVRAIDRVFSESKKFDILNECFGHFVRDNFRNHIEDAQYMTPNEAVDLMCDIAMEDIKRKEILPSDSYIVMDPCCGVGSFLSSFFYKNHTNKLLNDNNLLLIGQDKVDRMVRLSKINMTLANVPNHIIANGNSISGESDIDEYIGKVDLILTNPPFGAKFKGNEMEKGNVLRAKFPMLYDVIMKGIGTFNSEILFVDKCIAMLKPGGKMLAVLPDSVISSKGNSATLRYRIAHNQNIAVKAIIELPAVAFAQAGTRTKTSILYLEKKATEVNDNTFIGISENIGFEVSVKKGATVKREIDGNDMPQIFRMYKDFSSLNGTSKGIKVLSVSPSCVSINADSLKNNAWTPNHYKATKLAAVDGMSKNSLELTKLSDLVVFGSSLRRKAQISANSKCISVLHVSDEDLNYEEMLNYNPKYPGIVCKPGDLLFSKINPRIMRVIVVPDVDYPLTCSSEFEIMNSSTHLSNYAIKLLLMHPSVQAQINSLTSGTSSSHNRIKTADLAKIFVPLPKEGTKAYTTFVKKANEYESNLKKYNNIKTDMLSLKQELFSELV